MREADVLKRIVRLAGQQRSHPAITKGIGDDCAVLRPPPGCDLVFTTDFLMEGRHFEMGTHKPSAIGHKALARSLSDLAAMGAQPLFCLVSLALPSSLAGRWLESFYRGLLQLAQTYEVTLAGGDLSKSDHVVADVMCCGSVPRGKALLRSGAKAGHRIYVTGKLGRAKASGWQAQGDPRIEAGLLLRGKASAAMDLSDGLSLDLQRLGTESSLSAALRSAAIPIAPGATLEDALHGGEDYELLFTLPPRTAVPQVDTTEIGVMVGGKPGAIQLDGKRLRPGGFDHFQI